MSGLAEGIYEWSVEEMLVWLRKENLHDCVKPFSLKKIDGRSFLNLSDVDIKSLCISQESKRKLVKALQMAKGKKKALIKRFGNGVETRERRKPPSFTLDDEDDSDSNDGWATDDFDDSDDESEETWGVGLEDEDIQQENKLPQESPKKEVPNIPSGLVAQLRKGLAGSFNRNSLFGYMPPQHNQNQAVDPDDIYDEPPAGEDDLYEEPSDDSGSGIVIRNTSHQMATRSLSETGGYIDEWRSKNNASDVQVPCPPRPPKPGRQPPPPVMEDSTQEFYEVPESDPLGPQMDEQYEIPGNEEPGQETYEIPGNDEPEVYEEPEEGQQTELYEIPEQEEQIETYEVPDQSPAPPMRIQAKSLEPPGKPISAKPSLPFKPFNKPPPGNKPAAPPNKPKIKERPPVPPLPKSDIPGPKRLPSAPSVPTRVERNTNEVLSPTSPVKNQASDRRPVPTPVDDTPPPPPRPGSKHGSSSLQSISSRIEKLPPKPPRLSDSDQPEDDQVIPRLDKLLGAKRPLPSKPTEPKFSGDRMKEAPWFQSSLPRTVAESSLKSFRKDGTFIVRNSSNDPNNFSMSLYYNGHVRHLRIPRVGDKFVLGDSGKKEFNTLMELVDYYSQNNVELKTGGFTCLTVPCPIRK